MYGSVRQPENQPERKSGEKIRGHVTVLNKIEARQGGDTC